MYTRFSLPLSSTIVLGLTLIYSCSNEISQKQEYVSSTGASSGYHPTYPSTGTNQTSTNQPSTGQTSTNTNQDPFIFPADAQRCEFSYECEEGFKCYQSYCVENPPEETPSTCPSGQILQNGQCTQPDIIQDTHSCLTITPTHLNFGSVHRGSSTVKEINLKACQNQSVTITNIRKLELPITFQLNQPNLPITLSPNEVITLEVTYSPDIVGQDFGVIEISSNDPNRLSESVSISGEALPPQIEDIGLHVRLEWDTATDMDMHLVQGDELWSCLDCHWLNRTPEWGNPHSAQDNPYLDLDDTDGFGPENINISEPQAGTYKVYIHYYSSWTMGYDVPTNITLTFFSFGQEVGQYRTTLNRTNDLWLAAQITFPGSQISIIDQHLVDNGFENGCSSPW